MGEATVNLRIVASGGLMAAAELGKVHGGLGNISTASPATLRAIGGVTGSMERLLTTSGRSAEGLRGLVGGLSSIVPSAAFAFTGLGALGLGLQLLVTAFGKARQAAAEAQKSWEEYVASLSSPVPGLTPAEKIASIAGQLAKARHDLQREQQALATSQGTLGGFSGEVGSSQERETRSLISRQQHTITDLQARIATLERAETSWIVNPPPAAPRPRALSAPAPRLGRGAPPPPEYQPGGLAPWLASLPGSSEGTDAGLGGSISAIEDYADATARMLASTRGPMQQHWRDIAQTAEHWQSMQDRAAETGKLMGNAFGAGMQALVAEGGGTREAARAVIKSLRDHFTMKAAGEVAAAVENLALGKFAAAALHAKSAMLYGLAAGAGGLLSGGGTAGTDGAAEAARTTQSIDNRGEGTIIIMGGILDMGDPRQRDALSRAITQLSGLRSITVRSA